MDKCYCSHVIFLHCNCQCHFVCLCIQWSRVSSILLGMKGYYTIVYISNVIAKAHFVSLCTQWKRAALYYLYGHHMLRCWIVDRKIMKSLWHSFCIRKAYDSILEQDFTSVLQYAPYGPVNTIPRFVSLYLCLMLRCKHKGQKPFRSPQQHCLF